MPVELADIAGRASRVRAGRRLLALVVLAQGAGTTAAVGQGPTFRPSAQATAAAFYADPVPGTGSQAEVRVTRAVLMAPGEWGRRVAWSLTLNLEGLTIPGGELTPGAWGEGFVDRRHPHTYVHELMLEGRDVFGELDGGVRVGLAVGKGFAAFGTDDPMTRAPLRFPVNHHWAQILERAVVIAQVGVGPFILEGSLFNGDEPERPGQWPRIAGRFGDSWSIRGLLRPGLNLELQGSLADVHSPEHRPGAAGDARKVSLSALGGWSFSSGDLSLLAEWARTAELDGTFVFHSLLVDGALEGAAGRLYYRFERTARPEEERLDDQFRSQRPHLENAILGTSRWTLHTIGVTRVLHLVAARGIRINPFGEVTLGRVTEIGGAIFDVRELYGRETVATVTVGVRVALGRHGAGSSPHRMGRYGLLREDGEVAGSGHGMVHP